MNQIYYSKKLNEKFLSKLKEKLTNEFNGCKKIAIKIHFGEPGNKNAFSPEQIKPIIKLLKEIPIDFFFYDSSVAYNSPRNNSISHKKVAEEKGWGKLGEINTEDKFIETKGKYLNYEVARPLAESDGVLIISHFKGHVCCGFGGAIKNLGMGALSKKSKSDIHSGGKPEIKKRCLKCGKCVEACPINGIELKEKPEFKRCYGCSNCIYACPHKVLEPKIKEFDFLLADGATAAQSKFKKFYYINFLINISKECDCEKETPDKIAEDIGYLFGKDAVAIDNASKETIIKKQKEDVFLKFNKKSGEKQIDFAEKLGMGKKEYSLIEINNPNS